MTDDPRIEQLMNQELDGTNTPAESADLARRLAADPALRTTFDRLRDAVADLDAVAEEVPPRSLWPSVAREIAADRATSSVARRETVAVRRRWRPQLAWAFCTGLAVGLLALVVVTWDDQRPPVPGLDQPYGSLALVPAAARPLAGSPWQAAGVSVAARGDGALVELTVDHETAAVVSVTLDVLNGAACVGWQDLGGGLLVTVGADGGCVLRGDGSGRTKIWFRATGDGDDGMLVNIQSEAAAAGFDHSFEIPFGDPDDGR